MIRDKYRKRSDYYSYKRERYTLTPKNKRMNTVSGQTNTPEEKTESSKIYKSESSTKWTDIVNIGITAILAFVTFLLFREATIQSNIAEKSSNAAVEAVKEQRFNDSIMRNRDSVNSIADSVGTAQRFKLESASLQAQINSLKETQKNFARENECYLQYSNFNIDTFEVGKSVYFSFRIENFGNNPAKVLNAKEGFAYGSKPPTFDTLINHYNTANSPVLVNTYFSKDHPIDYSHTEAPEMHPLTKERYDYIINGNGFIYFFGMITYENLVTKKSRIYKYMIIAKVRIHNKRKEEAAAYLLNENDDIQTKK